MEAKEYGIVSAREPVELQNTVNDAIAHGWQPLGGLCWEEIGEGRVRFYQAIIKI